MFISDSFRQDILSKNTKIIPIVLIEKVTEAPQTFIDDNGFEQTTEGIVDIFGFSTNNLEITESAPVGGVANPSIYLKPILLGLPKLKESIDIESGKYKISSVTLNFSNVEYNGSRMSDIFTNSMMINQTVSVHLKSQSCTTITPSVRNVSETLKDNDCAVLYVGKIRDISHTDEKLTIRLEDLTESKIHKELPQQFLGDDASVPDKYKNKPIPMVYGHMPNAPLVGRYTGGKITFQADYKEIDKVNESYFWSEDDVNDYGQELTTWLNGAIKTYDENYLSVLKYVQNVFVKNKYTDENNSELNEEYVDFGDDMQQYYINPNNTISINSAGLWGADRVQGIESGKPKKINFISKLYGSQENDDFELIDDNSYELITDGNSATFANIEESIIGRYHNVLSYHTAKGSFIFSLRYDTASNSAKFNRLIRTQINGYNMPVKGDANLPSGYGLWDFDKPNLFAAPYNNVVLDGIGADFQNNIGLDYEGTGLGTYSVPQDDIVIIHPVVGNVYYETISQLFTFSANHGLDNDNNPNEWATSQLNNNPYIKYEWNDDAGIKFKSIFNSLDPNTAFNDDMDSLPVLRFHMGTNSYQYNKAADSVYCIDFLAILHSDYPSYNINIFDYDLRANINDINYTSISEYDNAESKDYYGDINGRVDTTISDEYLQNPIHIMRHILKEECGVVDFDEDEYDVAVDAHTDYKFAFSVKDKIDSKKLLEDISKNTQSYPRLKNNGKFGFVTLKRLYEQEDYESALLIDNNDIVKYDFKLTDVNKLISSIDVDYDYDFGSNGYLKKYTNAPDMTEEALKFYGIEDVSDNKVTIELKHTNDLGTAFLIGNRKFYNNSAQHLIINMQLPLQYSEVEVGTVIKFEKDKLIDDMKAYGMDYTNPIKHGRSYRYPLFLITEVQRGLDSISISCYQLHKMLAVNSSHTDNHEFWNDDNFPNINLIDPALNLDEDFLEALEEGLGDVNLDGNLNVMDVVTLASYLLGDQLLGHNLTTQEQALENADVNIDGQVDILDVVLLVNIILGNV
jgi:hypothetical protein